MRCAAPPDIVAVLGNAIASHRPLIDYGLAHAALGHAPPAPPAEHTRFAQEADPANRGILEHYVRDLTVRAAAGITIGDLQEALAATNQFAPIDADDDITLGEAIHHNMWGPLRVGYGSIRDLLLGLGYIDGEGRDIRVGGRTVKNVAGYDVTRFMVGSLGELGVVHEATLRTYAIPESVLEVEMTVKDPAIFDERGTDLILSDAKPTHLSLCHRCGRHGAAAGTWVAQAAYFGRHTANIVQRRALEMFTATLRGVTVTGSTDSSLTRDAMERSARRAWRRNASAVVKIIVPPASTGAVCNELLRWADQHFSLRFEVLPLHGCVFAGGDLNADLARKLDALINDAIQSCNGMRVWHARPAGAEDIAPFGPPQPDWALLGKLKKTMDPHKVLNPGRFVRW